jgi:hypothetical protein
MLGVEYRPATIAGINLAAGEGLEPERLDRRTEQVRAGSECGASLKIRIEFHSVLHRMSTPFGRRHNIARAALTTVFGEAAGDVPAASGHAGVRRTGSSLRADWPD